MSIVPISDSSEEEVARLLAEGRVLPSETDELIFPEQVRLRRGTVEDLIQEQRD
jgi:hypothetical protein